MAGIAATSSVPAGIPADEIVEHTLTQIQECYLFELPPRVRAQGWLAADMTKQMWTGRMRVVQRGMEAAIMLLDRRDGKLFAMCKVADGAVERVPDSSRYFVIKIQNAQGRHAFVGLAFDDRNQAFDFNVALQEFKKDVERSKMLEKEGHVPGGGPDDSEASSAAKVDLSLKQGEKIKISIGGSKPSSRPRRSGGAGGGGGGGGLTLAPPPGDTARKAGGGGIGLLAPPPGDTRRARGIAKPLISSPPTSMTGTALPPPAGSSPTAATAASPPAATPFSSSPFPGTGSSTSAGGGGGGGGGAGVGQLGGSGGIMGFQELGGGGGGIVAQSQPPPTSEQDDDPLGLGLGIASTATSQQQQQQAGGGFSGFSSPPAPVAGGAGWGLSDMSALGGGLPTAGMASAQQLPGAAGLDAQRNVGYTQDPFSQPSAVDGGQAGFPTGYAASPPVGGGAASGAGQSAASDDPFGGLF